MKRSDIWDAAVYGTLFLTAAMIAAIAWGLAAHQMAWPQMPQPTALHRTK